MLTDSIVIPPLPIPYLSMRTPFFGRYRQRCEREGPLLKYQETVHQAGTTAYMRSGVVLVNKATEKFFV